jgi:hypothetical protein
VKRIIYTVAAAAAVLTGSVAAAAPAMASTPPHLTGSVALSGPAQYESFNNIGGPSGSVSYTNFTYPSPGSGVWSLNNAEIDFGYQGGIYPHSLTVDSIQVTGLNSYTFTGHGVFNPDPSYTWNATGSVSGTTLSMHIVYTGTQAGYSLDFTGTINPDGSVTGTSFSDSLGRSLTVSMPAGSAFEVLSYTAPASNVRFSGSSAQFSFVIPASTSLGGMPVTVNVTDGGNPGVGHDLYAHNGTSYTITGGNLTVH